MTPENARITQLFDQLDRWRHLPAYQLERRADLFFSLYLPLVVERHLDVKLEPSAIPEFPIKRQADSKQPCKADYLLWSSDRTRVVLVELKTDVASLNDEQDAYLQRAKDIGFHNLLQELFEVFVRTTQPTKYFCLLSLLERVGFITLPRDLSSYVYSGKAVPEACMEATVIHGNQPALDIVYVQPEHSGEENRIDFDRFAQYVEAQGDLLSLRFAESLRSWKARAGGLLTPPAL